MTYVTIKIIHKNNQTTIIQKIIVLNFVKIKTIIKEILLYEWKQNAESSQVIYNLEA